MMKQNIDRSSGRKMLWSKMSLRYPENTHPWFVLLCGLSCFIPLISIHLRDYVKSPLKDALTSQSNRELAVAAAALTFPVIFEILTDVITFSTRTEKHEKIKSHVQEALLNTGERSLLVLSVLASSIPSLMCPTSSNLVNIYYCFYRCRLILTGGALMISLNRNNVIFWPTRTINVFLFLLCTASIISSFADNTPQEEVNFVAHQIGVTFFLLSWTIFACCSIRWMFYYIPFLCKAFKSKSDSEIDSKWYNLFPLLHIATLTIASTVIALERRIYANDEKTIARSLFINNMVYILYFILIMCISVGKMKFEVIHGLVRTFRCESCLNFVNRLHFLHPCRSATLIVRPHRVQENVRALHIPRAPDSAELSLPR